MIAVVIMAGGVGTRLFPASTRTQPKQFVRWPAPQVHEGLGDDSHPAALTSFSLIQQTYERVLPLTDQDYIFVVTTSDLADAVREHLPSLAAQNLIIEPCRRNSAGACALATARIGAIAGSETVIIMAPADASIHDETVYQETLRRAAAVAEEQRGIVVVGIRPTRPATGYGYIRPGESISHGAFKVSAFVEKPDSERAYKLLDEGCLWNAGIFVWRVDTAREAFEELLPEHARLFDNSESETEIFEQLPAISIDVGIAERSHNVYCVAGHFPWDDLGTWDALGRVFPTDASGNVKLGSVALVDTQNSVAVAEQGQIVALGVSDLVIVRFGDTVLVCPRDRAQDVGKLEESRHGAH